MQRKSRSTWQTIGLVVLFITLLAMPSLLRVIYYYRGLYVPQTVPMPDHVKAVEEVPTAAHAFFQETDVATAKGTVVIDHAHGNTVQELELNVLLSRLAARGVDTVHLNEGDSLVETLRDAIAFVVIAPHTDFGPQEIEVVADFIRQGGRLLLVADPGRYAWKIEYDEYGWMYEVPVSDVTAVNSLGARFGLTFADDYVYNTARNAGNYQYVILNDLEESPLTAGLEEVIFYSAHSIPAGDQALITGDENTTSSLSEQSGDLALMSLGGQGHVLAVADLTFMTEPYNSTADNNRLIANIADFLVGGQRTYELADFPLFFGDDIKVVPMWNTEKPIAFKAEMLDRLALLKSAVEKTGRTLHWQPAVTDMDAIYVGLYGNVEFWPEVQQILASQGISFTLETVELERATPTPTPRLTPTPTPTPKTSPTPTPTPEPLKDWINFVDAGHLEAQEVALFYLGEQEGHQVLIVLAFSEAGLKDAAKILVSRDFEGCLVDENRMGFSMALCPVSFEEKDGEATPTPEPSEPSQEGGSILLVSDDDGTAMYEWWTSVYDFAEAASDLGYETAVWYTSLDGPVSLETMQEYDAVVWCTGDYQETDFNPTEDDLEAIVEYLDGGGRLILAGAFIGSAENSTSGILLDIQVAQADHPLAEGFEPDEVITLERFTAEEDYAPFILQESDPELIVFVRGPDSEFAGDPVITMDGDDLAGNKVIVFGFPIYLMPYEPRYLLATNAIQWLME